MVTIRTTKSPAQPKVLQSNKDVKLDRLFLQYEFKAMDTEIDKSCASE